MKTFINAETGHYNGVIPLINGQKAIEYIRKHTKRFKTVTEPFIHNNTEFDVEYLRKESRKIKTDGHSIYFIGSHTVWKLDPQL